ncbi:MAG: hypothetical protein OXH09_06870 [Gammaproteobacteria bacterium]|nr:hypothetical protein [Gammaproteobacteria bacterium]
MSAVLPAIILVSATLYLVLLIGSAVYGATRQEGGRDLFRSDAVKVVTVALVAALGVLPTEVLGFLWMALLRGYFDVTAYLFLLVTGPVVAAMAAIQAFALSRIYRARPMLLAAVYVGVYAATYAFWLSRIFNPPGDVVRYAAVVLVVGGITMALFARFAWRRPA